MGGANSSKPTGPNPLSSPPSLPVGLPADDTSVVKEVWASLNESKPSSPSTSASPDSTKDASRSWFVIDTPEPPKIPSDSWVVIPTPEHEVGTRSHKQNFSAEVLKRTHRNVRIVRAQPSGGFFQPDLGFVGQAMSIACEGQELLETLKPSEVELTYQVHQSPVSRKPVRRNFSKTRSLPTRSLRASNELLSFDGSDRVSKSDINTLHSEVDKYPDSIAVVDTESKTSHSLTMDSSMDDTDMAEVKRVLDFPQGEFRTSSPVNEFIDPVMGIQSKSSDIEELSDQTFLPGSPRVLHTSEFEVHDKTNSSIVTSENDASDNETSFQDGEVVTNGNDSGVFSHAGDMTVSSDISDLTSPNKSSSSNAMSPLWGDNFPGFSHLSSQMGSIQDAWNSEENPKDIIDLKQKVKPELLGEDEDMEESVHQVTSNATVIFQAMGGTTPIVNKVASEEHLKNHTSMILQTGDKVSESSYGGINTPTTAVLDISSFTEGHSKVSSISQSPTLLQNLPFSTLKTSTPFCSTEVAQTDSHLDGLSGVSPVAECRTVLTFPNLDGSECSTGAQNGPGAFYSDDVKSDLPNYVTSGEEWSINDLSKSHNVSVFNVEVSQTKLLSKGADHESFHVAIEENASFDESVNKDEPSSATQGTLVDEDDIDEDMEVWYDASDDESSNSLSVVQLSACMGKTTDCLVPNSTVLSLSKPSYTDSCQVMASPKKNSKIEVHDQSMTSQRVLFVDSESLFGINKTIPTSGNSEIIALSEEDAPGMNPSGKQKSSITSLSDAVPEHASVLPGTDSDSSFVRDRSIPEVVHSQEMDITEKVIATESKSEVSLKAPEMEIAKLEKSKKVKDQDSKGHKSSVHKLFQNLFHNISHSHIAKPTNRQAVKDTPVPRDLEVTESMDIATKVFVPPIKDKMSSSNTENNFHGTSDLKAVSTSTPSDHFLRIGAVESNSVTSTSEEYREKDHEGSLDFNESQEVIESSSVKVITDMHEEASGPSKRLSPVIITEDKISSESPSRHPVTSPPIAEEAASVELVPETPFMMTGTDLDVDQCDSDRIVPSNISFSIEDSDLGSSRYVPSGVQIHSQTTTDDQKSDLEEQSEKAVSTGTPSNHFMRTGTVESISVTSTSEEYREKDHVGSLDFIESQEVIESSPVKVITDIHEEASGPSRRLSPVIITEDKISSELPSRHPVTSPIAEEAASVELVPETPFMLAGTDLDVDQSESDHIVPSNISFSIEDSDLESSRYVPSGVQIHSQTTTDDQESDLEEPSENEERTSYAECYGLEEASLVIVFEGSSVPCDENPGEVTMSNDNGPCLMVDQNGLVSSMPTPAALTAAGFHTSPLQASLKSSPSQVGPMTPGCTDSVNITKPTDLHVTSDNLDVSVHSNALNVTHSASPINVCVSHSPNHVPITCGLLQSESICLDVSPRKHLEPGDCATWPEDVVDNCFTEDSVTTMMPGVVTEDQVVPEGSLESEGSTPVSLHGRLSAEGIRSTNIKQIVDRSSLVVDSCPCSRISSLPSPPGSTGDVTESTTSPLPVHMAGWNPLQLAKMTSPLITHCDKAVLTQTPNRSHSHSAQKRKREGSVSRERQMKAAIGSPCTSKRKLNNSHITCRKSPKHKPVSKPKIKWYRKAFKNRVHPQAVKI